MSSHHIVREKQEPALLILSFDYEQEELLGQLLEWSPTVAVIDTVFEKINSLGIKIDVCFGTSDVAEPSSEIIFHPAKNTADCIEYFIANAYPALNILGQKSELPFLSPYLISALDLVLITPAQKIIPLKKQYQKWLPAGTAIEFILEPGAEFDSQGLTPISQHQFITSHNGIIKVECKKGSIFIAEFISL